MDVATELTLGPILFHWPAEEQRNFYFRIADEAPLGTVYVGEVVCSKRSPFLAPYLPEIIDRLKRGGKRPVLSTLALIMDEREADAVRAIAAEDGILVEANDISTAALLAGRAHVVGPFVNVYNESSLEFLARNGARRVVLPSELPARSLPALAGAAPGTELEVQVFGRLPLAVSARCYHARSHGLHKDGCQYVCANDRDGLSLDTLDGKAFLAVNGTQTLSHTVSCLVRELAELKSLGVGCFRLWPQAVDMVAVARAFRDCLDGRTDAEAAARRLADLVDIAPFSNGFHHGREGAAFVPAESGPA